MLVSRESAFVLAVALGGCRAAHTEVSDATPDLVPLMGDGFVEAPPELAMLEADRSTSWWRRFGDPDLNVLVEAALDGNLDLREAAANVREAEARARAVSGARGPVVDLSFGASRGFSDVDPLGRVYSTDLTPRASIAWQADLFGRLRSAERAQTADYFASEESRLALTHALIAGVVRQRAEISVIERRLALARSVVESRTRTLEIVEGRYSRGVRTTSAVDVHLGRENLAQVEAVLPPLERDLAQARFALDVLLGRKPGTAVDYAAWTSALPDVPPPPVGVPAALIDRRPDLRAERLRTEAAAADVDVAIANLYPDLVLSGSGGWSADELGDLFSADTLFGNVLADLTTRIFSSGQLEAEVDAARARLDAVATSYAAGVLQAVREVEDALVAERRLREQLVGVTRQRDEALAAENLARERYRRGLESLLIVLETERRRAIADDQVLLLQGAVWNARVDLHLALGGDWIAEGGQS